MNIETNSAGGGEGLTAIHTEFREATLEARSCYRALGLLIGLLNGETAASFSVTDRDGMAVLLEAIRGRLELSLQGLGLVAQSLEMPDAWELIH